MYVKVTYTKTSECKHSEGPAHSCDYVDFRNRQIDRAWSEAGGDPWKFSSRMNELCGTKNWDTEDRRRKESWRVRSVA